MKDIKEEVAGLNAVEAVAKFLELDFNTVATRLVFLDEKTADTINMAIKNVNAFRDLSLVDRARAYGFEVVEENGRVETTITL